MRLKTHQILWHEKQPVFSVHFNPLNNSFATAGADHQVRIWKMSDQVEYLCTLSRHVASVNCVRFAPLGRYLASAGDDGMVIIWEKEEKDEESWKTLFVLRGCSSEIYDLSWSPCCAFIAVACVDNTCRIFNVKDQKCIQVLADHSHFVQGVSWDPLGEFLATQSSDKSVFIYRKEKQFKLVARHSKCTKDGKSVRYYHDENLPSFFRRLSFSTDGQFLATPCGLDGENHVSYLYSRGDLAVAPFAHLPSSKPAVAVSFSPVKYYKTGPSIFKSEYRQIYAVANQEACLIYDTQHEAPISVIANIHYATLTDLAWSSDGNMLLVSSTDGYCTIVEFQNQELGNPIEREKIQEAPIFKMEKENIETSISLVKKDKTEKKRITPILVSLTNA